MKPQLQDLENELPSTSKTFCRILFVFMGMVLMILIMKKDFSKKCFGQAGVVVNYLLQYTVEST